MTEFLYALHALWAGRLARLDGGATIVEVAPPAVVLAVEPQDAEAEERRS